jgi:ABC-type polysaccharide/polyol phosphate transport system ATPase subunit
MAVQGHPLDEALAIRAEGLTKVFHPDANKIHRAPTSIIDKLLGRRTADGEADEDEDAAPEEDEDEFEYAEEEDETGFVWALRDATFDLARGQAAAVVGPPNSGKTTLLNVLSGVLPPTDGRALVRGRIWPATTYLTRFMQPAVTVRQNAVLAAKVAGLSAQTITDRMPELYEALGIDPGRELRAAGVLVRHVAVATGLLLEPDVLLLDAPTLFGDPAFRDWTVSRLLALRAAGGTILLEEPSHDVIDELCDTVIWLRGGVVARAGNTNTVLPEYVAQQTRASFPRAVWDADAELELRGFSDTAAIHSAAVETDDGTEVTAIVGEDPVVVHVKLEVALVPVAVRIGCALTTSDGRRVWIAQEQAETLRRSGMHDVFARLDAGMLPAGRYSGHVEAIVTREGVEAIIGRSELFSLQVTGPETPDTGDDWLSRDASWTVSEQLRA